MIKGMYCRIYCPEASCEKRATREGTKSKSGGFRGDYYPNESDPQEVFRLQRRQRQRSKALPNRGLSNLPLPLWKEARNHREIA